MKDYTEDQLVEQPAIELFRELGWESANCFYETYGSGGTLGRETSGDVVLTERLRPALKRLNPDIPDSAIDEAIVEITRDWSTLSPPNANRELYLLIRNGVKVQIRGDEGDESTEIVRVMDWDNPERNDFFLASQLWISGELYSRLGGQVKSGQLGSLQNRPSEVPGTLSVVPGHGLFNQV